MRAVTFDVSVPRYLAARTLGRLSDWVLYGPPGPVSYGERPEPELPRDDWVLLDVVLCGICGSDIANLGFSSSPSLEPFGSFPAIPGHEILGRVREVGPAVHDLEVGQRVVVDPQVSCTVRGWGEEPCPSCAGGRPGTCERAGESGALTVGGGPLAPGSFVGYHRDLPGGWGERMIAHRSHVFPVDDALDDRTAVLVEPLSVGMHAVLDAPPPQDARVLVIGSGPIALGTVWALRASGFGGYLLAQTKRAHEARLARRLGATEVVSPGDDAREALLGTGARAYEPMLGPEVYAGGGFPLIFDCVGSRSSLQQALRFAAPRGRIALLGCAAKVRDLDLTFVWARELEIHGFVGYGTERFRGRELHTFEVTLELLLETGAPVQALVTHVFPLPQYRDGLAAAANHRRSRAVKVLLEP